MKPISLAKQMTLTRTEMFNLLYGNGYLAQKGRGKRSTVCTRRESALFRIVMIHNRVIC